MNKKEFLSTLEDRLYGLPKKDIEDRLNFFEEIIDDKMSEGKSEEQAVYEIGNIEDIVLDITKETPLVKLVKEKVKPKRKVRGWEIALLILGFPLWLPLLITFFVLLFVLYLLVWVMVIVSYSVEISFIASMVASIVSFFAYFSHGTFNASALGLAIGCLGLAILMYYVCKIATKATIKLSSKILVRIKKSFVGKGE